MKRSIGSVECPTVNTVPAGHAMVSTGGLLVITLTLTPGEFSPSQSHLSFLLSHRAGIGKYVISSGATRSSALLEVFRTRGTRRRGGAECEFHNETVRQRGRFCAP